MMFSSFYHSFSFIRTVTVGFGFTPNLLDPFTCSQNALAGFLSYNKFTAGGEFHPALRIIIYNKENNCPVNSLDYLLNFFQITNKVVKIFDFTKIFVNRGITDIGDMVGFGKGLHHQLTNLFGRNFIIAH
jgi:hypothetical protein